MLLSEKEVPVVRLPVVVRHLVVARLLVEVSYLVAHQVDTYSNLEVGTGPFLVELSAKSSGSSLVGRWVHLECCSATPEDLVAFAEARSDSAVLDSPRGPVVLAAAHVVLVVVAASVAVVQGSFPEATCRPGTFLEEGDCKDSTG